MILRRMAEAIRTQDWFIVAIEVALVIAGVLVALQVDSWNDTRLAREEERRLISQLQLELNTAIDYKETWLKTTEAWSHEIASGIEVIQSNNPDQKLSPNQCQSIWASHLIFFGTSNLATLDEMLASGGLANLSNKSLGTSLLAFAAIRKQSVDLLALVRSDFANLIDMHADAFPRFFEGIPETVEMGDASRLPINTLVECQLDKIRANQTLKNRIISNLGRTIGVLNETRIEINQMRALTEQLRRTVQ